MNHPTQEDLVSYLYLDLETEDAASLEEHLDGCPACRDEVALLRQVLAEVSESDHVPERPADYPARVWERVAAELPRPAGASARARARGRSPIRLGALLAAAAALLLATFLVGRFSGRWAPPDPESRGQVSERVLLVALSDHIEESQILLLEVANRGDGLAPSASALDRRKAEDLLHESRLYRQTAYRLGDAKTADLLEELERLLLDVSHATDSEEAQKSIQNRIREQDILFKLRVLDQSIKSRERKLSVRKL